MRHYENLSRGKPSNKRDQLCGTVSEYGLSVFFGVPWEGRFFDEKTWKTFRGKCDIQGYEIRSSPKWSNLVIGEDDLIKHPDTPFIQVRICKVHRRNVFERVGIRPVGWITPREAKDVWQVKWNPVREIEFTVVSASKLYPMSELPLNK